jgi:ribosomal 50S subunit-recycling heat shock protein
MMPVRLDKYLKVSRLIKRRTVANEICTAGRVQVNGRAVKAGTEIKIGDVLEIGFGTGATRVKVLNIRETVRKEEADTLYEILPDQH